MAKLFHCMVFYPNGVIRFGMTRTKPSFDSVHVRKRADDTVDYFLVDKVEKAESKGIDFEVTVSAASSFEFI